MKNYWCQCKLTSLLHGYYNKLVNLQNYTLTNVCHYYAKMYKFYIFFFLLYTHSCECS